VDVLTTAPDLARGRVEHEFAEAALHEGPHELRTRPGTRTNP
jgi:hypothetical protein